MRFEYENLVKMFENALLTELRGHGSGSDFLRTWVPDPEPVKSLINMADAADLESVAGFEVDIANEHMTTSGVAEIAAALKGIYTVSSTTNAGRVVVNFSKANA